MPKDTVLSHDLIRRDIEIFDLHTGRHYNSEYIKSLANLIKQQIYKKLNGDTVGKIVYLGAVDFHFVVPSLIAVWELGAAIFLNDVDPTVQRLPYFQKFFDRIDIALGNNSISLPDEQKTLWGDKGKILIVNAELAHNNTFSFEESVNGKIDQDTIAYYTTSSGTTADPKFLHFSHGQAVAMSNYIKQLITQDYEHIRPLHFKTLHHGSLFNSFALPLLNSCQTHYSGLFDSSNSKTFLSTICHNIEKKQITHFLIPYNWIRELPAIDQTYNLENTTLITILGNTLDEMKDLFKKFGVKQVVNYFGCSEVGTIFTSKTDRTNLDQYNPNRFTDLLYYLDIAINPSSMDVKWKNLNQWHTIADKFEYKNGAYWFYGRDLTFAVGEKQVELTLLSGAIKEFLQTEKINLVPDYQNQKLYLATYQEKLTQQTVTGLNNFIKENFGQEFMISKTHWFDPNELLFGMKISGPLLLYLFEEIPLL